MIGKSERRSVEFLTWEARGRGFQVWDFPVVPEPLFYPFPSHGFLDGLVGDDGRKPTLLSSFVRRLGDRLAPPAAPQGEPEERKERTPRTLCRDDLVELQAHLPASLKLDVASCVSFFGSIRACREPVAFEIVATAREITMEFVVHPDDESLFSSELESFFPDVAFVPVCGFLANTWGDVGQAPIAAVEFGLGKEFMIPLSSSRGDPFVGLIGALGEIGDDEVAVFQVIFSPVSSPWGKSILRSVSHADGSAYFINAPELLAGAREKVEEPLYAAVVRVAAKTQNYDRTLEILCNAGRTLGAYGSHRGNELIPLLNDGYPQEKHEEDVVRRQTHRSGMLLNASELAGFVHLPSSDVRAPRLRQKVRKTKAAPAIAATDAGLFLGTNEHLSVERRVTLSNEQRARHVHVIGASGTGKSTLLFNLIRQDIENGEGVSVVDPHGDLIDRVLGIIPEHRIDDVVLLDPSDEEHIVGFNILSAHSDWEKNLLAADLTSVFRRLSSSWGDQMNSVLSNALLAFMKSDRGGTLIELRRFLLEPAFRSEFLKSVSDPNVVYYWQKGFPQLGGNKSIGSVITRLDTFLSPESIRYMVAQRENRLDFGDIMNRGKIFLAKLSQGAIGKDNSHLLGSLIVAKLQSEAMARQRQAETARRYHWAYLDEFHDFLTPSLADSLSGVRKYRLGLVLGHQEMRQVERDPDVASALLSNAYTRVAFRVGDKDARTLEHGFAAFEAKDLQNLGTGEAICRVERSDFDFNLSIPMPEAVDEVVAASVRARVIENSRRKYATPRAQIQAALAPVEPHEGPEPVAVAAAKREKKEVPAGVAREPVVEKIPPVPAPEPAVRSAAEPVRSLDSGRGGAQHTAIQKRLKEAAEALGFRATVEKAILERAGSIDLALERSDMAIACEITISTTIDHEVGNVAKCVRAGWKNIAAIGVGPGKLVELREAVTMSLGADVASLVRYYLPDAFIEYLKDLPPPEPPVPEVRTVKGYKVKTTFPKLSPTEAEAKENAALRLMADMMRAQKRQTQ